MWLFPIDIYIINSLKYGWIMNNQDPYTSRELGSWMGLDSQDPYTPRGFESFFFKRCLIAYDYIFVTPILLCITDLYLFVTMIYSSQNYSFCQK